MPALLTIQIVKRVNNEIVQGIYPYTMNPLIILFRSTRLSLRWINTRPSTDSPYFDGLNLISTNGFCLKQKKRDTDEFFMG